MADAEQSAKEQPTKNVERSTPYPGMVLSGAITATGKLRTSYGASSSYSRESVAEALGHQTVSGPANKKIAALVHFGLITRQGTAYKQSEIANRIFNPLTDAEKRDAIIDAFSSPSLYKKLIDEYDNQAVPTMFDKVLIRKYKIAEKAASSAAKSFIASAEFAGILSNGILQVNSSGSSSETEAEDTQDSDASNPDERKDADKNSKKGKSFSGTDLLPVELQETGIVILFPQEYAYELSIGSFATGIKELASNAKDLTVSDSDEVAPTTTEE